MLFEIIKNALFTILADMVLILLIVTIIDKYNLKMSPKALMNSEATNGLLLFLVIAIMVPTFIYLYGHLDSVGLPLIKDLFTAIAALSVLNAVAFFARAYLTISQLSAARSVISWIGGITYTFLAISIITLYLI